MRLEKLPFEVVLLVGRVKPFMDYVWLECLAGVWDFSWKKFHFRNKVVASCASRRIKRTPSWHICALPQGPAGEPPRGSGAAPVKTGGGNRAAGAIIRLWARQQHVILRFGRRQPLTQAIICLWARLPPFGRVHGSPRPHSPLLCMCPDAASPKKHPFGGVFLISAQSARRRGWPRPCGGSPLSS